MDRIRDLIIQNYSKLTDSDRYIAKTLLNNPRAVKNSTIDEFAEFCAVSKSTVIRFTQKIGLDGFAELKVLLKLNQKYLEVTEYDFVNRVADNDIQVINYYREYDFIPIIKLIESSSNIYAYGTGLFQQSFIKEIQRLFMHLGIWIRTIDGEGEFEAAIDLMNEKDCVILVSASGENQFLKNNYDLLELKGTRIISFTNSASNSLVYASDFNLSTELNKEKLDNLYYFDNIVTLYTPLKLLYANYVNYLANKM